MMNKKNFCFSSSTECSNPKNSPVSTFGLPFLIFYPPSMFLLAAQKNEKTVTYAVNVLAEQAVVL